MLTNSISILRHSKINIDSEALVAKLKNIYGEVKGQLFSEISTFSPTQNSNYIQLLFDLKSIYAPLEIAVERHKENLFFEKLYRPEYFFSKYIEEHIKSSTCAYELSISEHCLDYIHTVEILSEANKCVLIAHLYCYFYLNIFLLKNWGQDFPQPPHLQSADLEAFIDGVFKKFESEVFFDESELLEREAQTVFKFYVEVMKSAF